MLLMENSITGRLGRNLRARELSLERRQLLLTSQHVALHSTASEEALFASVNANSWEIHVRAVHAACAARTGRVGLDGQPIWPCSLDISPKTAQNFTGFSSLRSAEEELIECLPKSAAKVVCVVSAAVLLLMHLKQGARQCR